ncbi:2-hydroxyacid dehydrogenase [Parvibaculum sp.]|jgi:hydroxypyruvate reductase|uniref:2-hydroxyacid dehydrogenase n=1 Tax=Parvibaculum sp. TaxID=2024848 RepID=UPI000C3E51C3|nr:2-hydroxyacid dehydrogenase [Parvibaculum sp.]MAM93989.1 hydroxyacid dehydrogenase [Parvibaculum sp.]HCX69259.1 hydroxyacid dehydrogenase [Rhodobiaceae bacterium]|tara:strand:+ start:16268 stop:17185 length:918 start_codon:yes stop_codon:yes gene_type:complete
MKPHVFLAVPFGKVFEQQVAARYTIIKDSEQRAEAEALITVSTTGANGAYMDRMPKLKLICCFGSGYEGIDLAAAEKRGIKVANTGSANASIVADFAVALLLASIRKVVTGDQLTRAGEWRGENPAPLLFLRGLMGRKVGIVGLGAIGLKIAERLAAFETEIGYHNRRRKDVAYPYFDTVLDLAKWADVLILAHRADETNRHMVDAGVLAALGPEGHLVNISRGSAVDEDALIAALKNGTISGAALDVFENEPAPRADLVSLPNIVVTPHLGGGTSEAITATGDAVIANLDAFFAGKPLPNPVTT